jgi:hypothetical protein
MCGARSSAEERVELTGCELGGPLESGATPLGWRLASAVGVSACLVQRNFELRKVELGTCGRPYGTPMQTRTRVLL